jgi:hypothetical protein
MVQQQKCPALGESSGAKMAGRKGRRPSGPANSANAAISKSVELLGPLVSEKYEKVAEYKRRKPRFLQKKLRATDAEGFLQSGWTQRDARAGEKIIVEKQKPHDEILEDRFWSVLYQFGFDDLNAGRSFQIQVATGGETTITGTFGWRIFRSPRL